MNWLPVLLTTLLGGGLATAYLGFRKAPVERDSMRVDQADKVAGGALELLQQERERFKETLAPLTVELEALRRDRQHDREKCRQLTAANQGLQDLLEEKDREIARLRGRAEPRGAA